MANEIRLEVVDYKTDHFILYFDRPGRVEVSLIPPDGRIIAHVYDGVTVDMNQDPLLAFDGTVENVDVTK